MSCQPIHTCCCLLSLQWNIAPCSLGTAEILVWSAGYLFGVVGFIPKVKLLCKQAVAKVPVQVRLSAPHFRKQMPLLSCRAGAQCFVRCGNPLSHVLHNCTILGTMSKIAVNNHKQFAPSSMYLMMLSACRTPLDIWRSLTLTLSSRSLRLSCCLGIACQ